MGAFPKDTEGNLKISQRPKLEQFEQQNHSSFDYNSQNKRDVQESMLTYKMSKYISRGERIAFPYKNNPIYKCRRNEKNIKLSLGKYYSSNCCRQDPQMEASIRQRKLEKGIFAESQSTTYLLTTKGKIFNFIMKKLANITLTE